MSKSKGSSKGSSARKVSSSGNAALSTSSSTPLIIKTLTLKELKACLKNPKLTNSKNKQLFRIPSIAERMKVYAATETALANLEQKQMPIHNGRSWSCRVVIKEYSNSHKKSGKGGPLFRWYRGNLELANLPNLIESIPISEYYDEEEIEFNCNDLEMRQASELSGLAYSYDEAPVSFTTVWTSPLRESFRTRKSAMAHADELYRRDQLIAKVLFGCGARGTLLKPARVPKKLALEAGLYRFQRDGLWVVGQEEAWQTPNHIEMQRREALGLNPATGLEINKTSSEKYVRPVEEFIKSQRDNFRVRLNITSKDGDVTKEMRSLWAQMDKNERAVWKEKKNDYVIPDELLEEFRKKWDLEKVGTSNGTVSPTVVSDICSSSTSDLVDRSDHKSTMSNSQKKSKRRSKTGTKVVDPKDRIGQTCRVFYAQDDTWYAAKCINYDKETNKYTFEYNKNLKEEVVIDDGTSTNVTEEDRKLRKCLWDNDSGDVVKERQDWKLGKEQVEKCYDVVMKHYEQVMHTVQARGLQFELRDGFDLLRERGRLRFDMEIPALEEKQYNFLSSPKAPWIEVVRTILGKDNFELVHKGAFLSLPGAEAQVYHQDGPHLTDRYQKPCHAVNVFIPLVDLTMRNGPTEFCLGTHILGKEDYDKDFIDVPLASAGSPIIFDYRVGHRGLANTSGSPRPYIYLTYAAIVLNNNVSIPTSKGKTSENITPDNITNNDSSIKNKNWKDDVNFSRKRYRKLGDLIDLPQSREERQRRRLEKQYEQLKEESRTISELEKLKNNTETQTDNEKDIYSNTCSKGEEPRSKMKSSIDSGDQISGNKRNIIVDERSKLKTSKRKVKPNDPKKSCPVPSSSQKESFNSDDRVPVTFSSPIESLDEAAQNKALLSNNAMKDSLVPEQQSGSEATNDASQYNQQKPTPDCPSSEQQNEGQTTTIDDKIQAAIMASYSMRTIYPPYNNTVHMMPMYAGAFNIQPSMHYNNASYGPYTTIYNNPYNIQSNQYVHGSHAFGGNYANLMRNDITNTQQSVQVKQSSNTEEAPSKTVSTSQIQHKKIRSTNESEL